MTKTTTTSISLPPALARELGRVARTEHRTKSGLIQDAIRYYLESRRWKALQQDIAYRAERAGIRTDDDIETLLDEIRQ